MAHFKKENNQKEAGVGIFLKKYIFIFSRLDRAAKHFTPNKFFVFLCFIFVLLAAAIVSL